MTAQNVVPVLKLDSDQLVNLVKELMWVLEETIADAEKLEKIRSTLRPWRGVL